MGNQKFTVVFKNGNTELKSVTVEYGRAVYGPAGGGPDAPFEQYFFTELGTRNLIP